MNVKLMASDHEHCYWFQDDKYLYLVGASHCKRFVQLSSNPFSMARVQMSIEVIDKATNEIIKHRFANIGKLPSMPYSVSVDKMKKMLGVK